MLDAAPMPFSSGERRWEKAQKEVDAQNQLRGVLAEIAARRRGNLHLSSSTSSTSSTSSSSSSGIQLTASIGAGTSLVSRLDCGAGAVGEHFGDMSRSEKTGVQQPGAARPSPSTNRPPLRLYYLYLYLYPYLITLFRICFDSLDILRSMVVFTTISHTHIFLAQPQL